MSENRNVKEGLVSEIGPELQQAGMVALVTQTGLNAGETLEFRRMMRAAGVQARVCKNTLVKRAIADTKLDGLAQYLKGPVMLTFSADSVAAAKVAAEFAKKNKKVALIAAAMGGEIFDAKGAMALATLPSLDELRAKILGLLVAPATKVAGVLQAPAGQLARVMSARSKQAA